MKRREDADMGCRIPGRKGRLSSGPDAAGDKRAAAGAAGWAVGEEVCGRF